MNTAPTGAPVARDGAVRRDTHTLRWRIDGPADPSAPTLLVVGSTVYYPRLFSAALAARVRIVHVDHRGFARRHDALPEGPVTLDTVVGDVEALRAHLGLSRPLVFGHSGHAYMALAYAAAHPDRVSGLVLCAAGPSHAPDMHARIERRWAECVAPARKARFEAAMAGLDAAITRDPERRFVAFCLALGARMWADPGFDASPLWDGVETDAAVLDALWGQAFARIDTGALLEAVRVPVLLALGALDYAVAPPETWEPYRARVRDLTVRVFEASAHSPMREEPEAFDAVLEAFLARCGNGI